MEVNMTITSNAAKVFDLFQRCNSFTCNIDLRFNKTLILLSKRSGASFQTK